MQIRHFVFYWAAPSFPVALGCVWSAMRCGAAGRGAARRSVWIFSNTSITSPETTERPNDVVKITQGPWLHRAYWLVIDVGTALALHWWVCLCGWPPAAISNGSHLLLVYLWSYGKLGEHILCYFVFAHVLRYILSQCTVVRNNMDLEIVISLTSHLHYWCLGMRFFTKSTSHCNHTCKFQLHRFSCKHVMENKVILWNILTINN